MRVKLTVDIKEFGKNQRKEAHGYYKPVEDQEATILVDSGDSILEQLSTLYHEFTHFSLDIVNRLSTQKLRKQKKARGNAKIKKQRVVYVDSPERAEELLCGRIEKAVMKEIRGWLSEQNATKKR